MSTYRRNIGDGIAKVFSDLFQNRKINRGAAWGMIIISALLAFEVFNFSTTQFALADVLGDLEFAGLRWATILAIAFCGIDFAGIARIFTPEQGRDEPAEVYYLFGAWLLAAMFNATLTWWGIAVAIVNHQNLDGGQIISNHTMTTVVPVFLAAMVLLIRVLLIGTFSLAGDRLFSTAEKYQPQYNQHTQRPIPAAQPYQKVEQSQPRPRPTYNQPINQPVLRPASSLPRPANSYSGSGTNMNNYRPAPKPAPTATQSSFVKNEPTYHPVSYGARATENEDRYYDA
jgi:hypothetical protein